MEQKICIIDDDEELLEFLETVLTDAGYSVGSYTSTTFTDVLAKEDFDLVLIDGWFDELNMGPTMAAALKQHQELFKTPVLAMSSDASMKKFFAPYVDEYLQKPFDPDELLTTVSLLIDS